jgi:5-methylcytosine-specific restriction endonuclease McrA
VLNPGQRKVWDRHYYETHKEKAALASKKWATENALRVATNKKKWNAANPEKVQAWHKTEARLIGNRESRKNHPERHAEYSRRWKGKNKDRVNAATKRRRAKRAGAKIDFNADAFYKFVRSKESIPCYYCGKRISGKLAHIDHVIALSKSGNHASDNLAASCPKCNLQKHAKLPSELHFTNQPLLNL